MLEFLKKQEAWGFYEKAKNPNSIKFMELQELAIMQRVSAFQFSRIAVIGQPSNDKNIEINPLNEVSFFGFETPKALFENIENTQQNYFDVICSYGIISKLSQPDLETFIQLCHRLLKKGSMMIHAFEFIIENKPSTHWQDRFDFLLQMFQSEQFSKLGDVQDVLSFNCEYSTMPDAELFERKAYAPVMDLLRQRSQTVILIFSARKN